MMPFNVAQLLVVTLLAADAVVTTVTMSGANVEVASGGVIEASQSVGIAGICESGGLTAASVSIFAMQ